MLVLTRKAGQSVVISRHITLTVTRIAGNRVVLAFKAPRHVPIQRSELVGFDEVVDDEVDMPPDLPVIIDRTGADCE